MYRSEDARRAAVRARDAKADGAFVYAVKTTGVYCRPSCAARPARPENVEFHATNAEAERAGFRACKRCKPNDPPRAERDAALVASMCRYLEANDAVRLDALASQFELSAFYTHRLFKSVTGVTPKAYAAAHKAKRMRGALGAKRSVTEAIYEAGYASPSRFYEASRLGMTPTRYRAGGAEMQIRYAVGESTLGRILVAATARGICAIAMGEDREALVEELSGRFPRAEIAEADAGFAKTVARVIALVERPKAGASLPLDIRGTAFQERVWKALREIPPGATTTYSAIASAIGAPAAVRAVAGACAANAIAVAIPCHRVVRSDGDISGYRWGVERKRALLARERS